MDIDPRIGLSRAAERGALDRIEREQIAFFDRTRRVYLHHANTNPRIVTVDASKTLEEVQQQLKTVLTTWLESLT